MDAGDMKQLFALLVLAVTFAPMPAPAAAGMPSSDDGDPLRAAFADGESDDGLCFGYAVPVDIGWISSEFGDIRQTSGRRLVHKGIDYAAAIGTPVTAAAPGEVVKVGRSASYGRYVLMQHPDGLSTFYAHLSRVEKELKIGVNVDQGSVIGFVGRTGRARGSNLHFELRVDELPIDPAKILSIAAINGRSAGFERQEDCRPKELDARN